MGKILSVEDLSPKILELIFKTANKKDSRYILYRSGAEELQSRGDAYFYPHYLKQTFILQTLLPT